MAGIALGGGGPQPEGCRRCCNSGDIPYVPALQAVSQSLHAATACVALDLTDALGKSDRLDLSSFRVFSSLTALRRCITKHSPAAFFKSKRMGDVTQSCM